MKLPYTFGFGLVESTLYPTWFRWNPEIEKMHKANRKIFISHMVQMKPLPSKNFKQTSTLYIPHGSDETYQDKMIQGYPTHFISHMVQMKHIFGKL